VGVLATCQQQAESQPFGFFTGPELPFGALRSGKLIFRQKPKAYQGPEMELFLP